MHFLPDDGSAPVRVHLTWRDDGTERPLDNPEGLALSPDGRSLFVVTDDGRNSRLVQYDILAGP